MSTQELDKIQEAVLNYDTYEPSGTYGVTSLEKPRYQLKIEKEHPGHDCTPTINKIDSFMGTAFHERAEAALEKAGLPVETEKRLSADIKGYLVGGTCDLIITLKNGKKRVGDWKTMKAFPAKKALNGEHDKFIKQLSLYSYMLRAEGYETDDIGTIYVVVTGWTQRDKLIPRTFRIDLPLMTDEEVEEYVVEKLAPMDEITVDCPQWLCGYCRVADVCPHNNHHDFKPQQ